MYPITRILDNYFHPIICMLDLRSNFWTAKLLIIVYQQALESLNNQWFENSLQCSVFVVKVYFNILYSIVVVLHLGWFFEGRIMFFTWLWFFNRDKIFGNSLKANDIVWHITHNTMLWSCRTIVPSMVFFSFYWVIIETIVFDR